MSNRNRHLRRNENRHAEGRRKKHGGFGGGGGGFIWRRSTRRTVVLLSILCWLGSARPACEISYVDGSRMYNYSSTAPNPTFPHGVLSEDGFYEVTGNDTVLWFQLCNEMIFDHDPPKCIDCTVGVYMLPCVLCYWPFIVFYLNITDKMNPHMGVTVQMPSSIQKYCSLSVSIVCHRNGVQQSNSLKKLGTCDYATELGHPSGCAKVVYLDGGGWGWFGVFLIISYRIAGAAYRYFVLHIRGIDAIPNLEFWTSLLQRAQGLYTHIVQNSGGLLIVSEAPPILSTFTCVHASDSRSRLSTIEPRLLKDRQYWASIIQKFLVVQRFSLGRPLWVSQSSD